MSFLSEKPIKAVRKKHYCEGCGKYIEIGEPATNWAGLIDGEFCSAYYHPECRQAEVALNQEVYGWRSSDDWALLCDAERDDYRWLKANHPIAYRRLVTPRQPVEAGA